VRGLHIAGALLGLTVAVAGCGEATGLCDSQAVSSALQSTAPGDTVELGRCEIRGTFTVPQDVTLQGAGREQTSVVGTDGQAAVLTLRAGATLRDLRVRAPSASAVSVTEATTAALARVSLRGPVTADNAASVPPMPSSDETATHGLFVEASGGSGEPVSLTDVRIEGFGRFGALLKDSSVRWAGGAARANLGTGLLVSGGSVELEQVELCGTLEGQQPLPAYNAVFLAGAEVASQGLTLCESEGVGAIHDDVRATHENLTGRSNDQAALWVQQSEAFELSGTDSLLQGNGLAGVVVVSSQNVLLRDATIRGTRLATRLQGQTGRIEVGDGIEAVMDSTDTLRLEELDLRGNARAGLLLDVTSGAIADGTVGPITVEASEGAFGAIAQSDGGPIESDWDQSITRLGAATENDAGFEDPLDVVRGIAPMAIPR
jgi:hypothetical protein